VNWVGYSEGLEQGLGNNLEQEALVRNCNKKVEQQKTGAGSLN